MLDREVVDEAFSTAALADDEAVVGAQRSRRLRADKAAQIAGMQIDHVLCRAPEHWRVTGVLLPPLLHDRRYPARIVRGKRSHGHHPMSVRKPFLILLSSARAPHGCSSGGSAR